MRPLYSVFFCMYVLLGCQTKTFEDSISFLYKNTVPLIKTKEVVRKMQYQEPILLDARSFTEFSVSHLTGAQLIEYDDFKPSDVAHIPKNKEIIVYCSVGYRSERIGEKLLEMGYTKVYNLYGGIFDWKNQSQIVVNHLNLPTDSIHAYDKLWSIWLHKGIKVYE